MQNGFLLEQTHTSRKDTMKFDKIDLLDNKYVGYKTIRICLNQLLVQSSQLESQVVISFALCKWGLEPFLLQSFSN